MRDHVWGDCEPNHRIASNKDLNRLILLNSDPPCWLADENPYNFGRLFAINFATRLTISPSDVNKKSNLCLGCRVSKVGHMSMIHVSLYSCSLFAWCTMHSLIKCSSLSTFLPAQVAHIIWSAILQT